MPATWTKFNEWDGGAAYMSHDVRPKERVDLTIDHDAHEAWWECFGTHAGREVLTHNGTITYEAACLAVRGAT